MTAAVKYTDAHNNTLYRSLVACTQTTPNVLAVMQPTQPSAFSVGEVEAPVADSAGENWTRVWRRVFLSL